MKTAPLLFPIRVFVAALFCLTLAVAARAGEVYVKNGAAISGYDPVAYFTEGKPVAGSADITAAYKGATFRFASTANRDAFVAEPARYAPRYGGFCAFAAAHGAKAKSEPDAFSIVDGKLYLNFDKGVHDRWLQDVPGNIARGDENWPTIKDE